MLNSDSVTDAKDSLLAQAFPFNIVLNSDSEITQVGESLARIFPDVASGNHRLETHFDIDHPNCDASFEQLIENSSKLFILKSIEDPRFMLRAQLHVSCDQKNVTFLGSPWLTDLSLLSELGLKMSDFPLHSPVSDFLMLVQAQRVSLEDSKRLSDELSLLNKELEARVERRTQALERQAAELLESKVQLENEMSERQRVEVELRHAQKLEAVGQMSAGIAHEINTPIQFVGDSLKFLNEAFSDLTKVASISKNCLPTLCDLPETKEIHDELDQALEDADIEYLDGRVPKALERAGNGVKRVSDIVKAMKDFSHPDEREMTVADLNSAIESTLVVAANEYKYSATLKKELQELPPVLCHLGDINQVILNLVVNAAHAIIELHGSSVDEGLITIKSRYADENILISIADNGSGIPESIQERIFDPFFTTKEVGKGTGQGLSISHKIIVENHGGQLFFETEDDAGTTFFIKLPLDPSKQVVKSEEKAA